MDRDRIVELLLEIESLKRIPRSGWLLRGVPQVESVAEHSYGVTFVALVLADVLVDGDGLDARLNLDRVLSIALLHDLAEVRLMDLPMSASRLLPGTEKRDAETRALSQLLAPLPGSERLASLWLEFEDHTTPEGRLVRDADKLEMMAQCLRYEQAGSHGLDEFWATMDRHEWHYALSADLYNRLRALRPASA